jgi:DNA-binding response OmpR family regulator
MKILVIDDHPLIQEALKHVLIELDASLELIQAHAALSRTSRIDLLVLDSTLPGCDGFDLLADLRRDWPDIPVLVLSATYDRPPSKWRSTWERWALSPRLPTRTF